jgi:hypothetical protein
MNNQYLESASHFIIRLFSNSFQFLGTKHGLRVIPWSKYACMELTVFLLAGEAPETSKALIVVAFGHFVPGVHSPQTM